MAENSEVWNMLRVSNVHACHSEMLAISSTFMCKGLFFHLLIPQGSFQEIK